MALRCRLIAVVVVIIAANACAAIVDELAAPPVSVIDRASGRPIPGVVVLVIWMRAHYTLEESGEAEAIRVYETVTGPDGIAKIPTTHFTHLPFQGVSRKSPHIVVIKRGWMLATQWDARWNDHTVFQPWDDSDQAVYDLQGYLARYCQFMNWYKVAPEQMPGYRREILSWLEHFHDARATNAIQTECSEFH